MSVAGHANARCACGCEPARHRAPSRAFEIKHLRCRSVPEPRVDLMTGGGPACFNCDRDQWNDRMSRIVMVPVFVIVMLVSTASAQAGHTLVIGMVDGDKSEIVAFGKLPDGRSVTAWTPAQGPRRPHQASTRLNCGRMFCAVSPIIAPAEWNSGTTMTFAVECSGQAADRLAAMIHPRSLSTRTIGRATPLRRDR